MFADVALLRPRAVLLTVVRVVAIERSDGDGEENVLSAPTVVDCPANVPAVAPDWAATLRAPCSVFTVGAAERLFVAATPSIEERKDESCP